MSSKTSPESHADTLRLLQQQCIVPDVSSAVHIDRYLQLCTQLYADSLESHGTISVRYVSIKRFLLLVTKLYTHHGFASAAVRKQRLYFERCMRTSLEKLEGIAGALMAEAETQARARAEEEARAEQQKQGLSEADLFDILDDDGDQEWANTPVVELVLPPPAPAVAPRAVPVVAMPVPALLTPPVVSVPAVPVSVLAVPAAPSFSLSQALDVLRHTPNQAESRGSAAYLEFQVLRGDTNTGVASATATATAADAPTQAPTYTAATTTPTTTSTATTTTAATVSSCGDAGECDSERVMVVPGVSRAAAAVAAAVLAGNSGSLSQMNPGLPLSSDLDFRLRDERSVPLVRDDFYVSYGAVLRGLQPTELQLSGAAVETNRCFFLHLGIAVSIHPFLLQLTFRALASKLLLDICAEDADASLREDILSSVVAYAGFVDANALIWLWLEELSPFRICLLSGTRENPIISTFQQKGARGVRDVLMHCDGQHFTLLRPLSPLTAGSSSGSGAQSALPSLLRAVGANAGIIQEHELDCTPGHSVSAVLHAVL